MVEGTMGSHHKDGSRKMDNPNTQIGGIDIGKAYLDLAVSLSDQHVRVSNDAAGWNEAIVWFRALGVERIGVEASGGYERGVVQALAQSGLRVVLHQPIQVRAFARMQLQRAKNDRLDAQLIARFTAFCPERISASDAQLQALADHLVYIEQVGEDIARLKVRLEHCRDPRLIAQVEADIAALRVRLRREHALLVATVRRSEVLRRRLELLCSIPGIGLPTALALVIGMPELGQLSREQAASLIGLAPFDRDSGQHRGHRHIAGGRSRPRKALYAAALPAAFRWNPALKDLYQRLMARGKAHKQALVACARKLIIYANTVIARDTPWQA